MHGRRAIRRRDRDIMSTRSLDVGEAARHLGDPARLLHPGHYVDNLHLSDRFNETLDLLPKRLARVEQDAMEVSPQVAPE